MSPFVLTGYSMAVRQSGAALANHSDSHVYVNDNRSQHLNQAPLHLHSEISLLENSRMESAAITPRLPKGLADASNEIGRQDGGRLKFFRNLWRAC
jgi:hypothetical protein